MRAIIRWAKVFFAGTCSCDAYYGMLDMDCPAHYRRGGDNG